MKWFFFLTLPLYALDQWSKHWILLHVDPAAPPAIKFRDWFYLVNITNTGAAFGSFRNNNVAFIILSCVALIVIVTFLFRKQSTRDPWRDISLALLLAGVCGNLTDRFLHGHVIDFLLFDLHIPLAHPWPAFNVADSCICIAVFCFIIHSLREKRPPAAAKTAP